MTRQARPSAPGRHDRLRAVPAQNPCRLRARTAQSTWTFCASLPLRPGTISNSTRWPSSSERKPRPCMAEKLTKTSCPESGEMNPYPFSLLNHLTVPTATFLLLDGSLLGVALRSGQNVGRPGPGPVGWAPFDRLVELPVHRCCDDGVCPVTAGGRDRGQHAAEHSPSFPQGVE